MAQPSHRITGRRSQARGFATQRRMLDAAEDLFTRSGYEGASMADVAGRAGVGVGTLYHHYTLLPEVTGSGERDAARTAGAESVGTPSPDVLAGCKVEGDTTDGGNTSGSSL